MFVSVGLYFIIVLKIRFLKCLVKLFMTVNIFARIKIIMKDKTLDTKWLGFMKIKLRNYTILQFVIFDTCLIYFFTLKNVKPTEKLK